MPKSSEPLLRVRVLTEFDGTYGVYVSRCLETGHVVTADDAETASALMNEVLQDEITYAVEHKNFPNLYSSPASFDVWKRWLESAAKTEKVPKIVLNINATEFRIDGLEVSTEIAITTAPAVATA